MYNLGIHIAHFILKCMAPFNSKIKLGINGRQNTFDILEKNISSHDKIFWFHCASLGEYEQGLPIFKLLRNKYKTHKIVLTFFSPSGYEIRKKSEIADIVIYLPLDTKTNAKKFIDLIKPELTIFVKYDIWPNFLNELKSRKFRAILISASFRKNQSFFKFYGKSLREALFSFEHIFTQNEDSKILLESINYKNVTVSGDTRFDRVSNQLDQNNTLNFIKEFKQNNLCVVAGSTWPDGEDLFINYINNKAPENTKFIIAPHNIKETQIRLLKSKLKVETILFSEKDTANLTKAKVFIIDTIGLLSKIYSYADIAYVGGALSKSGLHNTLEPAVFGMPIIIGHIYEKFPEAKAMIDYGGMFSISNQKEFNLILDNLIKNKNIREQAGQHNFKFIYKNKGAIIQIADYLRI